MSTPTEENTIKVVIRVRPSIPTDLSQEKCIQTRKNIILVSEFGEDEQLANYYQQTQTFQYDTVLGPESTQEDVFQQILPVMDSFINGENATCMCYGVTSSGKTYTMGLQGIISRAAQYLQQYMENGVISCQLLQIYNEKLSDLLQPTNVDVKLQTNAEGQTVVEKASQYFVRDADQLKNIILTSEQHRKIATTKYNEQSSRSHVILIIYLHDAKSGRIRSKLCLADLAGCERLHTDIKTQTGQETKYINISLQTLGKVVNQLAKKEKFISYRDSTLTKLLSDSIGGSHRTTIVVCISPCVVNRTETLNTLRFADRAKKIVNKPSIQDNDDESMDNESLLIKLREELERLQKELQQVLAEQQISNMSDRHEPQQKYTEDDIQALQERILRLEEILSLGGLVRLDTSSDKLSLQQNIAFAREQLDRLLRQSNPESQEILFKYKQNVQSLEKFKLVINKQKENATYLLDCLNKLSGQYLQKCLELEAASRQRRTLLQCARIQLLKELKMGRDENKHKGADDINQPLDGSEDAAVTRMEAEVSELELKKYWLVQKIQAGRAYLNTLRDSSDATISAAIQRQEVLQRMAPEDADQIRSYFKEQNALISLLKNRVLPLLDASNTGALEVLFRQIITALDAAGQE